MKTVDISVFVIRLAAAYVWLRAFTLMAFFPIQLLFVSDEMAPFRAIPISLLLAIGLHALLGAALWFGSTPLARRFFGGASAADPPYAASIAGLGFAVAGMLAVDDALQECGRFVYWEDTYDPESIVRIAWMAILGGALVLGGRRLGTRLFRSEGAARPLPVEIQSAAFSVLGAWISAQTLPELASMAVSEGWFDTGERIELTKAGWPEFIPYLLRLAIGIALFLGGAGLSRFWRWTQTAGLQPRRS